MRSRSPTGNAVNGIFPMLLYGCGIIGVATTCYIERSNASASSHLRIASGFFFKLASIATLLAHILRRCCLRANPRFLDIFISTNPKIVKLRFTKDKQWSFKETYGSIKRLINCTCNNTVRKSYQVMIQNNDFLIDFSNKNCIKNLIVTCLPRNWNNLLNYKNNVVTHW